MKRLAILLVVALAAAAITYAVVGWRHAPRAAVLDTARGADLAWIRAEFELSDAQFTAITALHENYRPVCAKHCADIAAARGQLAELQRTSATPADVTQAEQRIAALEAVCDNATRAHLREVAGAMSAGQGRRFLAVVEPHLAQQPHDGARGLGH